MSTPLPEPLPLFWPFKPLSSASAGVETLKDGRKKYWIKHDILKNVTPRMLAWWFGHMEGDVDIQGRRFSRYRDWHPLDHVYARYVRRAPDGSTAPGAQIALCEYLGRNLAPRNASIRAIVKVTGSASVSRWKRSGLAQTQH
jgi:hypothetical protein